MRPPILVSILGPTASGKSHLGLILAREFQGEILNCDSLQIYRRFNIGTGKLSERERQGIPHHLIDVLDPHEKFAAGEYARWGQSTIGEIESRGKLPILVGGTGFYFRALVSGLFPGPQRDSALRTRLQDSLRSHRPDYLWRILKRLDSPSAKRIHANDTPKLIRAIEVSLLARRPMSEQFLQGRKGLENHRVLNFMLSPPRHDLFQEINRRTQQMFDTGLVEEIEAMLASGVPETAPPFQALGYKEALAYIRGGITLTETIETAQTKTRQYAKRQIAWFKKEAGETLEGFGTSSEIQAAVIRRIQEVFAEETAREGG